MNSGKGDTRRPTDEKKVAENWPADLGPKDGKAKRFHKVYSEVRKPATAAAPACASDQTRPVPYIKYTHHGTEVIARKDLKGTHRDHCLCFNCIKFRPNSREESCKIANDTFANCVKHHITTPVFECPKFVEEGVPSAS